MMPFTDGDPCDVALMVAIAPGDVECGELGRH